MAEGSKIEWTEATWNPVTGCTKISAGCQNCYAERMARRLQAMGNPSYTNGFQVRCHRRMLERPLQWRRPKMIFVNSMGDLFHEQVPEGFIQDVLRVMTAANWHTFQVLTKRSERLLEMSSRLCWPQNVWMGVTVEGEDCRYRIEHLQQTRAHTKFLSLEPLLTPLPGLDLRGIDWVIVGGESGPGARSMQEEWVLALRDQCLAAGVPFFFKQWGGTMRNRRGRILEGRTWDEFPTV